MLIARVVMKLYFSQILLLGHLGMNPLHMFSNIFGVTEDPATHRTGMFLLWRGTLLTTVDFLLMLPEVYLLSEGLLASPTLEQTNILVDSPDMSVENILPSKESATIRTFEGQPLLVDQSAMTIQI